MTRRDERGMRSPSPRSSSQRWPCSGRRCTWPATTLGSPCRGPRWTDCRRRYAIPLRVPRPSLSLAAGVMLADVARRGRGVARWGAALVGLALIRPPWGTATGTHGSPTCPSSPRAATAAGSRRRTRVLPFDWGHNIAGRSRRTSRSRLQPVRRRSPELRALRAWRDLLGSPFGREAVPAEAQLRRLIRAKGVTAIVVEANRHEGARAVPQPRRAPRWRRAASADRLSWPGTSLISPGCASRGYRSSCPRSTRSAPSPGRSRRCAGGSRRAQALRDHRRRQRVERRYGRGRGGARSGASVACCATTRPREGLLGARGMLDAAGGLRLLCDADCAPSLASLPDMLGPSRMPTSLWAPVAPGAEVGRTQPLRRRLVGWPYIALTRTLLRSRPATSTAASSCGAVSPPRPSSRASESTDGRSTPSRSPWRARSAYRRTRGRDPWVNREASKLSIFHTLVPAIRDLLRARRNVRGQARGRARLHADAMADSSESSASLD